METPKRAVYLEDEAISAIHIDEDLWLSAIQMKAKGMVDSVLAFDYEGERYNIEVRDVNFPQ